MHILVLPSWYPTKEDPVKGSFFAEQAAALARFGHTVTVMAVYNDGMSGVQTEKCTDGNLTEYLIHVKPLRFHLTYFRILREMHRILRESGRPDIIHVHSFRAIRYARALKRRLHVPIVPIYIPRDKKLFHKVPTVVGKPYYPEMSDHRDYDRLAGELMERIWALRPEE